MSKHGSGVKEGLQGIANAVTTQVKRVGAFLDPRQRTPEAVRTVMKGFGTWNVQRVKVCRTPIQGAIRKFLDLASAGKLEGRLKSLQYDEIYHLFCYLAIQNPENGRMAYFRFDKNQSVEVKRVKQFGPDNDQNYTCRVLRKVSRKPKMTMVSLWNGGWKIDGDNFVRYDASKYNCQRFLLSFLKPYISPKDYSFIYQDPDGIFKALPQGSKSVFRALTDVANRFSRLIGKGKLRKKKAKLPPKSKTLNPWLEHVKAYRDKHPELSFKEVLKRASKTYR